MPYYISHSECTTDHPTPGWYFTREDDDGHVTLYGPFRSKAEALDEESDGAYSDWLYQRQRDESIDYRQDMIDAGRGHLLRCED